MESYFQDFHKLFLLTTNEFWVKPLTALTLEINVLRFATEFALINVIAPEVFTFTNPYKVFESIHIDGVY